MKKVTKTALALLTAGSMAVVMAGSAFAADATLTVDGDPTLTGSLIPAWAEKGADSSFYVGVVAEGEEVSGILADEATVEDGTVTVSDVNVTSELGDALNDKSATNTTYMYVNGGSSDTSAIVKDSTFVFSDNSDGKNANDFTGAGALFVVTGSENTKTTLTLQNVDITTDGFGRDAIIVDAYANAIVEDSTILTKGSNPLTEAYEGYASTAAQAYMISPPWILGIYGGVRSVNTLGTNSSFNLINSTIESGSWAVISTDDCTNPTLNILNSTLKVTEYDPEDSSSSMNGVLNSSDMRQIMDQHMVHTTSVLHMRTSTEQHLKEQHMQQSLQAQAQHTSVLLMTDSSSLTEQQAKFFTHTKAKARIQ